MNSKCLKVEMCKLKITNNFSLFQNHRSKTQHHSGCYQEN